MADNKLKDLYLELQEVERQIAALEAELPAPMTPKQFIALLDEMCLVACGEKKTRNGELVYVFSERDIHEADGILSGGDPGRLTLKDGAALIKQIRAINRDLEAIIKHCTPEMATQIDEVRAMARTAIEHVRAKVQSGTGTVIE